jgi:hypothetical protein
MMISHHAKVISYPTISTTRPRAFCVAEEVRDLDIHHYIFEVAQSM